MLDSVLLFFKKIYRSSNADCFNFCYCWNQTNRHVNCHLIFMLFISQLFTDHLSYHSASEKSFWLLFSVIYFLRKPYCQSKYMNRLLLVDMREKKAQGLTSVLV